jgi:hypothetical protein
MTKFGRLAAVGLLISGSAIACTVIDGVAFQAQVAANSLSEAASQLQAQLGSQYGRDHDVQGYVLVRVSVLGVSGATTIPFHKPCGETFEEAGERMQNASASTGGSSGEPGGNQGTGGNHGGGWGVPGGGGCALACGLPGGTVITRPLRPV